MIKKLKKPAAFLSAAALMFSSLMGMTASGETTVTTYIRGDMNGNGRVDIADLALHKSYMLSEDKDTDPLTEQIADFDGNGYTDFLDSVYLSQYLMDQYSEKYDHRTFTVTDSPLIPSSLEGLTACAQ
ncbi:MAG: dockerin type I repeat-containing protein, partial [Oscillospiraceae bacterium]|nr:dockerin type I repeat-containing protein [Oscillospiraceae bacterium]